MEYVNIHQNLIEDCKQGKRTAQFELYNLYSKAMYNVCLRMVRNEVDAEDLLQNSFVDIFTKLHTFGYQSAIGAWMKRIVVNNCINFLQRRKVFFEELSANHFEQADDNTHEANSSWLTVSAVQKAMMQLPDGYRVVFSLYALEGYDHEEIAEVLHITESTSKSQYSRAKQKLKEIILAQRN